jgi:hypothetical protein
LESGAGFLKFGGSLEDLDFKAALSQRDSGREAADTGADYYDFERTARGTFCHSPVITRCGRHCEER